MANKYDLTEMYPPDEGFQNPTRTGLPVTAAALERSNILSSRRIPGYTALAPSKLPGVSASVPPPSGANIGLPPTRTETMRSIVFDAPAQDAQLPYSPMLQRSGMGPLTQEESAQRDTSAMDVAKEAVPAGISAASAALWSTGIGAGLSILGTGANIWMSLYAMKEQRKEARKTRALQMSLYEDQKATEAAQFNRIQGREDERFIEEKKWKLADARNAALTAWRNMMLEQPMRIQNIFNANKMYRRA